MIPSKPVIHHVRCMCDKAISAASHVYTIASANDALAVYILAYGLLPIWIHTLMKHMHTALL